MYIIYRRINDGSTLVFDADQHPEVNLAGNNYSFALNCKESANFSWTFWDIFDCDTI